MFTEGYSFPHPVLGNADDIAGEFNFTMEFSRTDDRKLVFDNFSVGITNSYIQSLIDNGDAGCFVKVHCSSTFSTWILDTKSKIEIDENDIVNRIDVQALVITQKEIVNYSDSSFNSQYGNEIFSLNKNEVVAISGNEIIKIPKVDEKLGLGNIFKFNYHSADMPMTFQFMQDKIFINYPETRSGEHPPNQMFSSCPWTAFNIFLIPAVSEALKYIDDDLADASRWEWFTVIDQLLPASARTKDYFSDAQKILQTEIPLLLSYSELNKN